MGVALATVCCFDNSLGGNFNFDASFTSSNGVGGHELASAAARPAVIRIGRRSTTGERRVVHALLGRVRSGRLAGESAKLTLNYGLRLEHEDGLREIDNRQTVGVRSERGQPDRRAGEQDRHAARGEDAAAAD